MNPRTFTGLIKSMDTLLRVSLLRLALWPVRRFCRSCGFTRFDQGIGLFFFGLPLFRLAVSTHSQVVINIAGAAWVTVLGVLLLLGTWEGLHMIAHPKP